MNRQPAINYFYFLAPLWFALETLFWPYFRAGLVAGTGTAGIAAFYAAEAGLGAALWFKLPYAELGALLENVGYLVLALKFVMFTPLDIALAVGDGAPGAEALARHYTAAMPGILYSAFFLILKIKKAIGKSGLPL